MKLQLREFHHGQEDSDLGDRRFFDYIRSIRGAVYRQYVLTICAMALI